MQIIRLNVDDNKCLVDFETSFEIDRDRGSSTILIGENGTGKSTMLQTILDIMMSFDSESTEKRIRYQYEIEYFYKGSTILIQYSEKRYHIYIDEELFCKGTRKTVLNNLSKSKKNIFPERISYFYSGLNNRLVSTLSTIESNYEQKCKTSLLKYWNTLYLANHYYDGSFPKRKYNYCTEKLVPIYLLALVCGNDSPEREFIREQCHIEEVVSATVTLNINGLQKSFQRDILEVGEEGICDLISFVDDSFTEMFRSGFFYQDGLNFIYDLNGLNSLDLDMISLFNFFEKLNTLFHAEIRTRLKVGESIVYDYDLSEGQRQLIKILGMLGVCSNEDTLVLMDEPDAHMNPKWKYELKETIDRCLDRASNTQALIATHDPLVINGVDKRFIRLFLHNPSLIKNNNWFITKVVEPLEDTEGLGVDGLLQSEYYGLKTSYDKKSSDKFIRRLELYSKLINEEADDEEKKELMELTKELGLLPISYNSIDFLYDDFIRVFKESELFSKEYLSYDQVLERREKIKEIIAALYEGQV